MGAMIDAKSYRTASEFLARADALAETTDPERQTDSADLVREDRDSYIRRPPTGLPNPPSEVGPFTGTYRFLSNFWPCPVWYDGRFWPSAEHAYQAAKTTDRKAKLEILAAPTPGRAKGMGGKVRLRPDWNDVRLDVMLEIVRSKFFGNDDLAERLLATGDRTLIEYNSWGDRFWGVDRLFGDEGYNHLGRILMKVRTELRKEAEL